MRPLPRGRTGFSLSRPLSLLLSFLLLRPSASRPSPVRDLCVKKSTVATAVVLVTARVSAHRYWLNLISYSGAILSAESEHLFYHI